MPPRLARLLAILGVIALVAGAFVLRGSLADDDETVTSGGSGDDADEVGDGPLQVLCDEDLGEDVCAVVDDSDLVDDVQVVRSGSVAELLVGADGSKWDAWLTLDPMPGVLDVTREEEGLTAITDQDDVVEVASSELAVLSFDETALSCLGETATWECLTEPVNPEVAVASLLTSVGAVSVAAGAAGLMDATDFDIGDFADGPAGRAMSDLIDEVPNEVGRTTADQTEAIYATGTSSAVVTSKGLAGLRVDTDQGRGRSLRTVRLTPEVRVGVVLAGLGARSGDATRELADLMTGQTVRTALTEAGWSGGPAPSDGLPEPGLMYAILEELS